MPAQALTKGYQDIATQFISNLDIDVILDGGCKYTFPKGTTDLEYLGDARQRRVRLDRRNLDQEWQAKHQGAGYVWNRRMLIQVSPDPSVTHLLDLSESGDMKYEAH